MNNPTRFLLHGKSESQETYLCLVDLANELCRGSMCKYMTYISLYFTYPHNSINLLSEVAISNELACEST